MARYDNPFAGTAGSYPVNPAGAALGHSLVRALFGDPQAREAQQLHDSQILENQAQARNANSEADARNLPIKYQGSLASSILAYANAVHPQPQAQPDLVAPDASLPGPGGLPIVVPPGFEGVARAIATALPAETGGPAPALVPAGGTAAPLALVSAGPEPTQTQSPEALGAMAQLFQHLVQAGQGAHVPDFLGTIDAQAGNDETARRGFIGAGHDTGEHFALTPERADEIARMPLDAAMAREQVQSADRRYGDNLQHVDRRYNTDVDASTARRGQDIGRDTAIRGQDVGADVAVRGQDVRAAGTGGGVYQSPIRGPTRTVPGGQYGAPRNYGGHAGDDLSGVRPGTDVHPMADGTVVRRNRTAGGGNELEIRYLDGSRSIYKHMLDGSTDNLQVGQQVSRDDVVGGVGNTGSASHGNHLHVEYYTANGQRVDPMTVINQRPSRSAAAGHPHLLTRATVTVVDNEIAHRMGASWDRISPGAQRHLRELSMSNFQASGNPVAAVEQAVQSMLALGHHDEGGPSPPAAAVNATPAPARRPAQASAQNTPPWPGARRSPRDGNWYVQRGNQFFRVAD